MYCELFDKQLYIIIVLKITISSSLGEKREKRKEHHVVVGKSS